MRNPGTWEGGKLNRVIFVNLDHNHSKRGGRECGYIRTEVMRGDLFRRLCRRQVTGAGTI